MIVIDKSLTERVAAEDLWYRIDEVFGDGGGIYSLACLSSPPADTVLPIHRVLGEDKAGVLYIGMAMSFKDRAIELKKSLSPTHISKGHECGARYKASQVMCEKFPYENLVMTLTSADDPRGAERRVLDRYLNQFGELPPLNRAS